jgi:DNA-binding beta-propeller fold protein YncE
MGLRPAGSASGSQVCWWRRWWLAAVLAACLAGAAPAAQAQPFVYVANNASSSVSQYDAMGGGLSPLTPASVPVRTDVFPNGVAVSPDGRSVYVANTTLAVIPGGSVSQFDVGANGTLTAKSPADVPSNGAAFALAVSPDGKSVYVTNVGGTVSQYDVGAGGALTPKTPASVPVGAAGVVFPKDIAVSPDGRSVYVAVLDSGAVSQYSVGTGGVLSPKTPATVPTHFNSSGVAVNPEGNSVYVTNSNASTVSQYDVGAGGQLAPKSPATVAAGTDPFEVAVTPDGKSVYVTNTGAVPAAVSQYDVGAGGTLAPKTPAAVATGRSPVGVAVSPDGNSVYVTSSSEQAVFQYNVGPVGALSPKSPATVAAGVIPMGIAVSPRPRQPTNKDECKDAGWRNFPQFKNQGQCVAFVERGPNR